MKIRQEYAIYHNEPVEFLEENEQILLMAIHIYQRLNITNIQIFKLTYPDYQNYKNQQYVLTLEYISKQIDKEWKVYLKSFCKGLYQSIILSTIYETLQVSQTKQQQIQQKIDEKKQKSIEQVQTRKILTYGNCKIYSKENFFLCNCDEKKIRWYMKQGLADLISEDPLSIQLKLDEGSGKERELLKFNIVPVVYEKHRQGKRSYDVFSLCQICHNKASALNDNLKVKISEKYNINFKEKRLDSLLDQVRKIIKLSKGFFRNSQNLPKKAYVKFQTQLTNQIEQLKNQEIFININLYDLNKLKYEDNLIKINDEQFSLFIEYLIENEQLFNKNDKIIDLGKQVVDQLKTKEQIDEFLVFWRDNFINETEPQYLNEIWKSEHKFRDKSQYNPNNIETVKNE